jgi:hypothetical protein
MLVVITPFTDVALWTSDDVTQDDLDMCALRGTDETDEGLGAYWFLACHMLADTRFVTRVSDALVSFVTRELAQ